MFGLNWFKNSIESQLPAIALSEAQFSSLYRHFELLQRWNERMDLTSLDAPEEIVSRHYCESLFFASQLPESNVDVSVVDFGSGAGFPGFPVAVLRPSWSITLLEANGRRGVFLKESARDMPQVRISVQRGEECRVTHDWVIARAVKGSDVLRCLPKLGTKIGLLVGESSLSALRNAPVVWQDPVLIPGSIARYCMFGDCST